MATQDKKSKKKDKRQTRKGGEDDDWDPKKAKAVPVPKKPTAAPQVPISTTGKVKNPKAFREWLISLLNSNKLPGVSWTNPEKTIFRIPWSLSSKHFDPKHHAVYLEYAKFLERPQEEIDARDLAKWKPALRAKINQQRDVVQLPEWTCGLEGAPGTFKVFEFRDPKKGNILDRSLRDRSQSYCGPWSQTLGIKQYDILCGRVKNIPPQCVTVGLVLEVYDFWKRKEMNNNVLQDWIGLFIPGEVPKDILHCIESLQIRRCTLETSGGDVNAFEKAMFEWKPVSLTAPTKSQPITSLPKDVSHITQTEEMSSVTKSPPATIDGGAPTISSSPAPPIVERADTPISKGLSAQGQSNVKSKPTTNAKGPGYLGPCCQKQGITQLKLLQGDFQPVSKWNLTNALVLEIYYFWQSLRFTSERFISWMSKLTKQELHMERLVKAVIRIDRKRHRLSLRHARGGRHELQNLEKALFPAYRYRTDVKYIQCQFVGCKKFPKQEFGYCSRHWRVVGKDVREQAAQQILAASANVPKVKRRSNIAMPSSWQQLNRLQNDLVAVTSSVEGTSRLPKVCIICNISLESSSGYLTLDEVVEKSSTCTKGNTVRARLQRILGEKPKGSTRLCSMCHSTLVQIEEFYNLLGLFKGQYIQSTNLRKPGADITNKTFSRRSDQDVIILETSPTDQNKEGRKRKADSGESDKSDSSPVTVKSIKWPADILRNLSGATADFLAQSHLPKEVRQNSEQKQWGQFAVKLDRIQILPDSMPKTTQKQKRRKTCPAKPHPVLVSQSPTWSYQQASQSLQQLALGTLGCSSTKIVGRPQLSASLRIKNCPNLSRLMQEARSSGGTRIDTSLHKVSAPQIMAMESDNLFYNDPFLDQMETANTQANTSDTDSTESTDLPVTTSPRQDEICISDVRSLLNMQMTDGTLAICIEPEEPGKNGVMTQSLQSFPAADYGDIITKDGSSGFLPETIPNISHQEPPRVIEIMPDGGSSSQTKLGMQDPPAVLEIIPTNELAGFQGVFNDFITESCSTTTTLNSSRLNHTSKRPSENRISEGLMEASEGQSENHANERQSKNHTSDGLSEKYPSKGPSENRTSEAPNENCTSEGPGESLTSEAPRKNHRSEGTSENSTSKGPSENPTCEAPSENPTSEGPSENPTSEGPSENPTSEGPSENPTSEGPSENPTSEGPSENPTSEGPSENPTSEGPSENLTSKGPSENPTCEALIENPTCEEQSDNPTSEGLSENPTSEGPSENPTSEGPSENPTSEGPSENPTSEGPSENPTSEGPSENPTSEGPSENLTSKGPSENPTCEALIENPTCEEQSDNPTSEGLSDNTSEGPRITQGSDL